MKIRTNVKAGRLGGNHNEKLSSNKKNLAVKTGVKAGINFTSTVSKSSPALNHNETLKNAKRFAKKLRLSKETIKELKDGDVLNELALKRIAGGAAISRRPDCSCFYPLTY